MSPKLKNKIRINKSPVSKNNKIGLDWPLSTLEEYLTAQKRVSNLSLINKKPRLDNLILLRHKIPLSDTLGILRRIISLVDKTKRDNSHVNSGSTLSLNAKIRNILNINSGVNLSLGRN